MSGPFAGCDSKDRQATDVQRLTWPGGGVLAKTRTSGRRFRAPGVTPTDSARHVGRCLFLEASHFTSLYQGSLVQVVAYMLCYIVGVYGELMQQVGL